MKYAEALQKRKLEVENLSKGIQKKIEELHYLNDAYNNLDSEGVEDEESKKNLEDIQEKISSLDESIADFIYAFDSEKYQKQLESMAKTRAKRKNAGGDVQESVPVKASALNYKVAVLVPVAPVSPVAPAVSTITVPVENVVAAQVAPIEVKEPVQERAVESVYDKLEDLKKSVHIDTANFKTRQRVEEEEEEEQEEDIEVQEEEFDKHSDTTPKKMSTGLILMGVGAFFLTWGAVNFFKSRR
jgi:hypothetical protein